MLAFTFVSCGEETPEPTPDPVDPYTTATYVGEWYVDRMAPAAFDVEDGVATITSGTVANKTDPDYHKYQGNRSKLSMTEASSDWVVTTNLILTQADIDNKNFITNLWLDVTDNAIAENDGTNEGKYDWTILGFKGGETPTFTWCLSKPYGTGDDAVAAGWKTVPAATVAPKVGNNTMKYSFKEGVIELFINDVKVATYEINDSDANAVEESIVRSVIIQVNNENVVANEAVGFTAKWSVPVVKYMAASAKDAE